MSISSFNSVLPFTSALPFTQDEQMFNQNLATLDNHLAQGTLSGTNSDSSRLARQAIIRNIQTDYKIEKKQATKFTLNYSAITSGVSSAALIALGIASAVLLSSHPLGIALAAILLVAAVYLAVNTYLSAGKGAVQDSINDQSKQWRTQLLDKHFDRLDKVTAISRGATPFSSGIGAPPARGSLLQGL